MKNEFYVTAYRFHVKDRNTLLIQGWFAENEMGENQLVASIDDEKLVYKTEQHTDVVDAHQCADGKAEIKNRMYLWVKLPKDWRNKKYLTLVNQCQNQMRESLRIKISHLEKLENKIEHCIDGGTVGNQVFRVTGWFVSTEEVKITLYDSEDRKLDNVIKYKRRNDVMRHYPECTEKEVHGFTAECSGSVPKKIKIVMKSGKQTARSELILKPSKIKKGIQKLKKSGFKAYVYYQQFGIKRTIDRFYTKLTHKDEVSYKNWMKTHFPTEKMLAEQRKQHFTYEPKISIVVPLYKTPEKYLDEMIDSIKKQTYGNWELCMSDGSGKDSPIKEKLCQYAAKDARIKVVHNENQLHISDNTNEALKICTGDYIAFGDHDDLLAPDAFYECVRLLNQDQTIEAIYTDEDKMDMKGLRRDPHFKSDYAPDSLLGSNYICHFEIMRKSIVDEIGGFRVGYEGAQDYDIFLRFLEKTTPERVYHIPKILYHWRMIEGSTAATIDSKGYAVEKGRMAVEDALKHPNWSMGAKITIDSATLFNKGLEVMEARWLFGVTMEQVQVVVQPQSVIHSMVEFSDNSVIAQLGVPDMRIPIQYALTYPARVPGVVPELDFTTLKLLTFDVADEETFRCLAACKKAIRKGGLGPCAANGANEEAVRLFLEDKIGFLDIGRLVEAVVDSDSFGGDYSLADVYECDRMARAFVRAHL